jgi:chemotaxis protein CheD
VVIATPRTYEVYLPPGGMYAGPAPCVIKTILGSCVSVTLWSPRLAVGGMNHFLLPRGGTRGEGSTRHGESALDLLLLRLGVLGARPELLEARVYGGATIVTALADAATLGARNVEVARTWLDERGIPIVDEAVLGRLARRVQFDVETGEASAVTVGGLR